MSFGTVTAGWSEVRPVLFLDGPERGDALLLQRGNPLPRLGEAEPVKLIAERRVEQRARLAVPVVQRVLGPPNGALPPAASLPATSSALSCTASSSTQSDTRPIARPPRR